MAAPIVNDSFSQQVTEAFNMLKYATPQQMQLVAQFAQRNPQSPEATAFAMASQWQQNMRSAPTQVPTATILQQKVAQIPQDQGILNAGANEYALQAAATENPYQNAGLGAAAGGLVALAKGGGLGSLADEDTADPDDGDEDVGEATETREAPRRASKRDEAPQVLSLDDLISKYEQRINQNQDYAGMQQQLSEAQKEVLEAKKEAMPSAVTQGLMGLLATYGSPYAVGGTQYRHGLNESLAAGILGGMQGYEQGKQDVTARTQDVRNMLAAQQKLRGENIASAIAAGANEAQLREAARAHQANEAIQMKAYEAALAHYNAMEGAAQARGEGAEYKGVNALITQLEKDEKHLEDKIEKAYANYYTIPEERAKIPALEAKLAAIEARKEQLYQQMPGGSALAPLESLAPTPAPTAQGPSKGALAFGKGRPGSDAVYVPRSQ